MIETLALKESLRKALLDYKKGRPHLSMRAIAKNAGVNRYFLNKLLEEQDSSTSLDLNQVLILCKYITQKDSVTDVINASSKEVRDAFLNAFTTDYENNNKVISSSLFDTVDLSDRNIYFVLVLATFGNGTKKSYVLRILGEAGELALTQLVEKKIIVESDGRFKLRSGTDFTYDFKLMLQRIPDYLKYFDLSRASRREANFWLISEGVNVRSMKEIISIQLESYRKISKVLSDKNNLGDIPFFAFAVADRFLEKIETEENDTVGTVGS